MQRRRFIKTALASAVSAVVAPSWARLPRGFAVPAGGGGIVFTRFISTTGSDGNNGLTPGTAWAITSLQDTNSNNSSLAQQKIGLIAGSYDLSAMESGSSPGNTAANNFENPILHLPAGTTLNPTTIASCNSSGVYSPRVSTLNWGAGVSTTVNSMIGQNPGGAGNWVIDGLIITGYTLATGASLANSASNKQVGYYPGGSNGGVIIQNCDFGNQTVGTISSGSNDGAIFLDGATNVIIRNNKFHDIHKPAQTDHVHALCEFSTTGTLFSQNTVMNCDTGIDGKVNANGCRITENYFYNCGISGGDSGVVQGYDGDQNTTNTACTFDHNVFDSCPGEVRTVDVSTHIGQPNTYNNNTVYFTVSGSNGVWDLRSQVNPTSGASAQGDITFHDNITVTTLATGGGSPQGRLGLTSGFVPLCDFNCFFPTNASFTAMWALSGTAQNSISAWRTASSLDGNSIVTNPSFASTIVPGNGSAQFQLAGGSPCIGTGTSGGTMGAWDGTVTQIGCNF